MGNGPAKAWTIAILTAMIAPSFAAGLASSAPPGASALDALGPHAVGPLGGPDPVALLDAALPALARPYYAQLASVPLPPWAPSYAWHLVTLQNPVLDPGFEIGAGAFWRADGAVIEAGAATLPADATLMQDLSSVAAPADDLACTDGCGAVGTVTALSSLSFRATGDGTVDVTLLDPATGAAFATTPFAFTAEGGVVHVALADLAPIPPSHQGPAPLAEEAVVAEVRFTGAGEGLILDDVVLDARDPLDDGPHPRLSAAWAELAAGTFAAHDGLVVLVMPLAAPTPSFLVALVEHAPSGPRVLAPQRVELRSVVAGAAAVPAGASETRIALGASPYARLLDEAGLAAGEGIVVGASSAPAGATWTARVVAAEPSLFNDAPDVTGYLHLAKLLDPASPANDALDIVPDVLAATAGPLLFADLDGDGYTDAAEDALLSSRHDAADTPGRNPTVAAQLAATLVTPRIAEIRHPLATRTALLAPGGTIEVEVVADSLEGLTATLHATFHDHDDLDAPDDLVATVSEVAYPSAAWPGAPFSAWRVNVTLSESVPAAALGRLYDLDLHWDGGEDTQPRSVMLVAEQPTSPLVAVVSDARLGAETEGGDLARAIAELNLLRPDVVLFTGDIVGDVAGYDLLHEALGGLRTAVLLAPGDRDVALAGIDGRAAWEASFGPRYHLDRIGASTIVALDTFDWPALDRAFQTGGAMGAAQLAWAESVLEDAPGAIVFGHHSPSWEQDPWQAAALADPAPSLADHAAFWASFFGALGRYAPHPVDAPMDALATKGARALGGDEQAYLSRWSGANRLELRALLEERSAQVFFAGHALEDRAARLVDPEESDAVAAVGAGSDADALAGFSSAKGGVLYLDTTGLGEDGREFRGYRLWRADGVGLADGYHPTAATLAHATGGSDLWDADVADAGLYSVPLGNVSFETIGADGGRRHHLFLNQTHDEPADLTLTFSIDDLPGLLGGRDLRVLRSWSDGESLHVDVLPDAPVAGRAERALLLDDAPPATRLLPVDVDTNLPAVTLTVDPLSADDLDLVGIDVEMCAGPDCTWATLATDLEAGEDVDVFLPGDGPYLFQTRGRDLVGHVEPAPATPDASVRLDSVKPIVLLTATPDVAWHHDDVLLAATTEEGLVPMILVDDASSDGVVSAEGAHLAVASATDLAGNVGESEPKVFGIDRTPPRVVPTFDGLGEGAWNALPVSVTLTCEDQATLSGCASLVATFGDDGPVAGLSASRTFEEDGVHVLRATATDAAGNEAQFERTIRIDRLDPVSSHAFSGTAGNGRWFLDTVTVTLSCDELGGSACSVRYRLDEGAWASATAPLVFDAEDDLTLEYQAVDDAGNEETTVHRVPLGIDLLPPATTVDVLGEPAAEGWHVEAPLVRVSCVDSASACAATHLLLDGVAVAGSEVTITTSGVHEIVAWSEDEAGNVEPSTTRVVRVDLVAPILTLPSPPTAVAAPPVLGGDAVAGPSGAVVDLQILRDGLEVASLLLPVEDGGWSADLAALPLADGAYVVLGALQDGAGRASAPVQAEFRLDTHAPVVTLRGPSGVTNRADASFTLDYADDTPLSAARAQWRFAPPGGVLGAPAPLVVGADGALTLPLSLGEGTYELIAFATDAVGHESASAPVTLRVDRTAPSLTLASASRALASDAAYGFRADVADAGGVAARHLRVERDDGAVFAADASDLSVPLLSSTRRLTFTLVATDAAGNDATLVGHIPVIDPAAPLVTAALNGAPGSAGWFRGNVVATFLVDDPAAQIFRATRLEGAPGDPLAPGGALTIEGSGRHVLEYQGRVVRGGVQVESAVHSRIVLIDADAPTLVGPTFPAITPENERVPVHVTAEDVGSGLASVAALVDRDGAATAHPLTRGADGSWRTTIGPFRADETVRVQVRATDVAGHVTASAATPLVLGDATAPLVTLAPLPTRLSGVVELHADRSDASGIASLGFVIDEGPTPLPGSAWDTRTVTNGRHTVTATVTDAAGNVGEDMRIVTVDNLPVVGPLTFSPDNDTAPVPSDSAIRVEVEATTAGGRAPTGMLFHRAAGAVAFTETPLSVEPCAGSCAGATLHAEIAGPFTPGSTLEAYAVVRDGASSVRVPGDGVATVSIKLPVSAPLATWIAAARTSFSASSSEDIEESYADIVDAAVLRDAGWTTFAATLAGPFDPSRSAQYHVDLSRGDAAPFHSYSLVLPPDGVWTGVPSYAAFTADGSEWRLSIPNGELAADLGGAPPADLQVRFRTVGSGDATSFAALDLAPPVIEAVDVPAPIRGAPVTVLVVATDAPHDAPDVRVLATLDGQPLPPTRVVDGAAPLGELAGGVLEIVVLATDAAGNRASTTQRVILDDTTPPTAAISFRGGVASVPERATIALLADSSTDDVAVVNYSWELDAVAGPDAFGRRVEASFQTAGARTVTLTVADAAGNVATTSVGIEVLDVSAPELVVVEPAHGAIVRAGSTTILLDAAGADIVGGRLNGGDWIPAQREGAAAWSVVVPLSEGAHILDARATDAAGNTAILSAPVEIVADATPPLVRILTTGGVAGSPVTLLAAVDEANGIRRAEWQFEEGDPIACVAPCPVDLLATRTFTRAGAHTVRLLVEDHVGFVGEAVAILTIDPTPPPPGQPWVFLPAAPTAAFDAPATVEVGVPLTLSAVRDPTNGQAGFLWDLGDGTFATGPTITHSWAGPGSYVVTLSVATNLRGSTTSRTIEVVAPTPPADEDGSPGPDAPPGEAEPSGPSGPPERPGPAPTPPSVRPLAPTGIVASPVTLEFETDPGASVSWRVGAKDTWRPAPARVSGDGPVTIEYYATGSGGRSEVASVTLILDGAPPQVTSFTAPGTLVAHTPIDLDVVVEEVSPVEATLRLTPQNASAPLVLELERTSSGFRAAGGVPAGEYAVTLLLRDAVGRETTHTLEAPLHVAAEAPLEESGVPAADVAQEAPGLGVALLLAGLAAAAFAWRRRHS